MTFHVLLGKTEFVDLLIKNLSFCKELKNSISSVV